MIGVVRKNPDRTLFIKKGQLILKSKGNINQGGSEKNDWVMGPQGSNILAGFSKYKGGDTTNPNNYDTPDYVQRDNYPDI